MSESVTADAALAFDLLFREFDAQLAATGKLGAEAFEQRDFDSAREILDRAKKLEAPRDKVETLHIAIGVEPVPWYPWGTKIAELCHAGASRAKN